MSPSAVPSYAPDERSKGVRLNKRTKYEEPLVHGIIDECPILHVSFNAPPKDDGMPQFPTILPMLGAMGQYGGDEESYVYLHGSSVARLFKITNGRELPLCVCATLIDGYVLAYAPFHNSCNYRSAVVFGHGQIAEDPEEIMYALKLITNNSIPDRWENSRFPPTKAELTSTAILKVRIETASAKVRYGMPHDERFDMKNTEMTGKTWVGVVPSYQVLGDPVEVEYNRVKQVPEYLADWVADVNSLNEQKAVDAVEDDGEHDD